MSFNYWTELCEPFNVTNCGVHLFGSCYQCKSGYQFDNNRTVCTQVCNVDNCTSCSTNDNAICFTCQPGYLLTTIAGQTTCVPYTCNITNCSACNANGTACLSCITKFHVYNSTSNACEIQCYR